MTRIAEELKETVLKFKAIAKAKGIRYEIAAAKKDAIEKKIGIDGQTIDTMSITDNAQHRGSKETLSLSGGDQSVSAETIEAKRKRGNLKLSSTHSLGTTSVNNSLKGKTPKESGMDGAATEGDENEDKPANEMLID